MDSRLKNKSRNVTDQGRIGEARLGEAAGEVGQQRWVDEITNPAANRPSRSFLLGPSQGMAQNIRHNQVTMNVGEIVVGERADHPALADLEVAASTDRAEPAAAADRILATPSDMLRICYERILLIE